MRKGAIAGYRMRTIKSGARIEEATPKFEQVEPKDSTLASQRPDPKEPRQEPQQIVVQLVPTPEQPKLSASQSNRRLRLHPPASSSKEARERMNGRSGQRSRRCDPCLALISSDPSTSNVHIGPATRATPCSSHRQYIAVSRSDIDCTASSSCSI